MKAALTFMRQRVPEKEGDGVSNSGEVGQQAKIGQGQHSGKEQTLSILQRYYGHANFRGHQAEAVSAALENRDCFVLMPTGGSTFCCSSLIGGH
jgi:superfamily II DNA helicase RecQ